MRYLLRYVFFYVALCLNKFLLDFQCAKLTRFAPPLDSQVRAAGALQLPVIVTEQYPKALGVTVPEVAEVLPEGCTSVSKTDFSMVVPEVAARLEALPQVRTVIITGIEAHVCVLQTTLDLLGESLPVNQALYLSVEQPADCLPSLRVPLVDEAANTWAASFTCRSWPEYPPSTGMPCRTGVCGAHPGGWGVLPAPLRPGHGIAPTVARRGIHGHVRWVQGLCYTA